MEYGTIGARWDRHYRPAADAPAKAIAYPENSAAERPLPYTGGAKEPSAATSRRNGSLDLAAGSLRPRTGRVRSRGRRLGANQTSACGMSSTTGPAAVRSVTEAGPLERAFNAER